MSFEQQIVNIMSLKLGYNYPYKIISIYPTDKLGKYYVDFITNNYCPPQRLIVQIPIKESTIYIKSDKIVQPSTKKLEFPVKKQEIYSAEIENNILTVKGKNLTASQLCSNNCIEDNCVCNNADPNLESNSIIFNIENLIKDYPIENYIFKGSNADGIKLAPYYK